ncbi:MAG: hypothetical protein JW934_04720 [Anaerolineae bacterium]|nr:hypothetical protein [Anaerolineae bacterium]
MVFLLCGCMLTTATPDVEATVAAALAATQTAQPTFTLTSTPTHTPTPTPTPTHTATPTSTPTAAPTFTPTPAPTSTSVPEETGNIITSTLETGWTLYELADEGFAIALPPEWQSIDLNSGLLGNALALVGEKNPAFKEVFSSEAMRNLVASGVKFYGLDLKPETLIYDLPASMNIIQVDLGIAIPLDALIPNTLKQLETVADPKTPITHRRVTLSDLAAEELKYGLSMTDMMGNPVKGQITQYLLIDGTVQYAITLISPNELAEDYAPVFEQIGQSFQLFD